MGCARLCARSVRNFRATPCGGARSALQRGQFSRTVAHTLCGCARTLNACAVYILRLYAHSAHLNPISYENWIREHKEYKKWLLPMRISDRTLAVRGARLTPFGAAGPFGARRSLFHAAAPRPRRPPFHRCCSSPATVPAPPQAEGDAGGSGSCRWPIVATERHFRSEAANGEVPQDPIREMLRVIEMSNKSKSAKLLSSLTIASPSIELWYNLTLVWRAYLPPNLHDRHQENSDGPIAPAYYGSDKWRKQRCTNIRAGCSAC